MADESVRFEVRLGPGFGRDAFERALARFRELYNVRPDRALCAPDVLERYCVLFEASPGMAHLHSSRLTHEGTLLVAAIVAPGTVAFEGNVDDTKMGDW